MRYFWLQRIGRLHTLLSVLADPRARCSGKGSRAVSRLFLDIPGDGIKATIRRARRIGLVRVKFLNPYIIGSGESFISLTERGDRCVDATRSKGASHA